VVTANHHFPFGLRNTRRGAVGIIKTIKKQENKLVLKTANFTAF
jgi:hypothetical protein